MFNINFLHKEGADDNKFISVEGRPIRLIVGLGNPGEKYKNTYHNVGFMFLDSILNTKKGVDDGEVQKWKSIKNLRYAKLATVTLVKPTSFMNESGSSVKSALKYFNVSKEEIIVVHDDTDISIGDYKISFGKGSAGHNGVESIIKSIKSDEFTRLRIGTKHNNDKAGNFVLKNIIPEDKNAIQKAIRDSREVILKTGIQ